MDRNAFLRSADVNGFVEWLLQNLPVLPVHLEINSSRFVPNVIDVVCNGFNQILQHYIWRSTGMQIGDWDDAKCRLHALSTDLRAAVKREDESATLSKCEDILSWGGNRNSAVGALPFLQKKVGVSLCEYIRTVGLSLQLSTADTDRIAPPVARMNAMLTKVHALYATDGLPIYDSRVAAAIASLVELWRRASGIQGNLPPELSFPATDRKRTVRCLFPDAVNPGVLVYQTEGMAQKWSSAKVRLGWIISHVLKKAPNTVLPNQNVNVQEKMRAFEASLFMIGYHVGSLSDPSFGSIERAHRKRFNKMSR